MSDLHSLSIAFRSPGSSIRLHYNNAIDAHAAYAALALPRLTAEEEERGLPQPIYDPEVEITDNYGTTASVDRTQIMLRWVTNLGAECEGQKDVQTLNAHAQSQLQRRLASDPMLKGVVQVPAQPGFKLNG